MAVDPSIALGVKPLELQNPLAQYAQVSQIQSAQNQNALAQYQLSAAKRADELTNVSNELYSKYYNPATGAVDQNALYKDLAGKGFGAQIPVMQAKLADTEHKAATAAKAKVDAAAEEKKFVSSAIVDLSRNPSDENVKAWAQDAQLSNTLTPQAKANILKEANSILAMPAGQRKAYMSMAGASPSDITSRGQLGVAQSNLNLARDKFAWEKANPGYELKEAEDGSIVGVNKRTLQAVPVTMGAAPAAGAVPAAGATPAPVVPLKGKGTALTESQGNATAFGMRMLESDKLLKDLEKAGTTSGGRIKGAVEGTLSALVPYQGEKLAEGAGAVMNVLPGVMGGPNESQQQYEQAKKNFITAVLRKESGASINPSEFATEEKKYFPQAGESDKVIAQKQRARELAIEAMKIQAGPGAKHIGAGADPLGIRQ